MAIKDALLPEYDHEMGTTRKLLERVPDERLAWKPHQKSMTLGRLATHLAELPAWVARIVNEDSFNMTGGYTPRVAGSKTEILSIFDQAVAQARATLAGKSDPEMMAPWTFKRDGKDMFTLPKIAMVRSMLMNHSIHHRGQLSVYLRLNDVPLPAMYGPSADEG